MDLYKIKWIANLRKEQMQKLSKLAKLEIRHKLGLDKDEEFSYYLFSNAYKSWLHIDAEREYLEAHGLLPVEEPEEEPVPEPEPEPEKEPGLISELDYFTLMMRSISVGENCYTPSLMKEYEDRILLTVSKMDENYEMTEHSFELPIDGRFVPFELDGMNWLWDRVDNAFRIIPEFDENACKKLNEHFSLLDESVLAVEKNYAEEKLSDKCRSYAFKTDEKAYYWCIPDGRYRAVCHELPELFFADKFEANKNQAHLTALCFSYFEGE